MDATACVGDVKCISMSGEMVGNRENWSSCLVAATARRCLAAAESVKSRESCFATFDTVPVNATASTVTKRKRCQRR